MIVHAVSVPAPDTEIVVIPSGNPISVMSIAGRTSELFPVQQVLLSC